MAHIEPLGIRKVEVGLFCLIVTALAMLRVEWGAPELVRDPSSWGAWCGLGLGLIEAGSVVVAVVLAVGWSRRRGVLERLLGAGWLLGAAFLGAAVVETYFWNESSLGLALWVALGGGMLLLLWIAVRRDLRGSGDK